MSAREGPGLHGPPQSQTPLVGGQDPRRIPQTWNLMLRCALWHATLNDATTTKQDLYDSGCVTSNIKYGVLLYGKARLAVPLDLQVRGKGGGG